MQLSELLSADRVKIPLQCRTKDDVLRELVELAVAGHDPRKVDAILLAVRNRELVLSTGVGGGVAIPHGKTPAVDQLILAAGISEDPIEFDALDGNPVQVFFLLIGPESAAGAHVKTLSRISRLLRRDQLRQDLRRCRSAKAFLEIVRASEAA